MRIDLRNIVETIGSAHKKDAWEGDSSATEEAHASSVVIPHKVCYWNIPQPI